MTEVESFTLELARRIEEGQNIVYFDETSCNLWMRRRMAWSGKEQPVKYPLNQFRGKGVTCLGAIGETLPRGVFQLAESTNSGAVCKFLLKLRNAFSVRDRWKHDRIVLVADNHTAHKTLEVKTLAHQLNIELLFLPPYTPELNSIEALWSVVKAEIKHRLLERRDTNLQQADLVAIMNASLANV